MTPVRPILLANRTSELATSRSREAHMSHPEPIDGG